MKNERTVYTTRSCFPFTLFSSCNRKNENGYNGSYFYFSFFVWGLEKRKRMLGYPFSIFYYEIEKRKTKGRYIHGPSRLVPLPAVLPSSDEGRTAGSGLSKWDSTRSEWSGRHGPILGGKKIVQMPKMGGKTAAHTYWLSKRKCPRFTMI